MYAHGLRTRHTRVRWRPLPIRTYVTYLHTYEPQALSAVYCGAGSDGRLLPMYTLQPAAAVSEGCPLPVSAPQPLSAVYCDAGSDGCLLPMYTPQPAAAVSEGRPLPVKGICSSTTFCCLLWCRE